MLYERACVCIYRERDMSSSRVTIYIPYTEAQDIVILLPLFFLLFFLLLLPSYSLLFFFSHFETAGPGFQMFDVARISVFVVCAIYICLDCHFHFDNGGY